ncbi:MAG: TolC family protein, partial [Dysgonamonadaceae bacterium]|nr:TolC family protein [Dysgonamonadaceae bacterium]
MHTHRYIFLLMVIVWPVLTFSQSVYPLQQVLQTGLERNYDIRIVRNEQQISDNNATRGNAG